MAIAYTAPFHHHSEETPLNFLDDYSKCFPHYL